MGEVSAITFESLYETVRKEKTTEDLQMLNPDFYTQVTDYLRTKTEVYKAAKEKNNMNPLELEKIKTQIVSARKLIKDLYERREKKVLQLSLHKSRLNTADESGLLPEERMLFDNVTVFLDKFRKEILLNLVNARLPSVTGDIPVIQASQPALKQQRVPEKEHFTEKLLIKFTTDVPAFLGPHMETYGPFVPGDEINLYTEMAETLLKMKAAEKN
jgi:DNA replication initiation complex subunit (GINS family)